MDLCTFVFITYLPRLVRSTGSLISGVATVDCYRTISIPVPRGSGKPFAGANLLPLVLQLKFWNPTLVRNLYKKSLLPDVRPSNGSRIALVFYRSKTIWLFRPRKCSLKQIDQHEYNSTNVFLGVFKTARGTNPPISAVCKCSVVVVMINSCRQDRLEISNGANNRDVEIHRDSFGGPRRRRERSSDAPYSIRQFNGVLPPLLDRKVFLTTFPRHGIYTIIGSGFARLEHRGKVSDDERKEEEETRIGHGLRGDFKLISMWDFYLPRKQRTSGPSFLSLSPFLFSSLSPFALPRHVPPTISSRPKPRPNSSTFFDLTTYFLCPATFCFFLG